jgi:hypothetical protein
MAYHSWALDRPPLGGFGPLHLRHLALIPGFEQTLRSVAHLSCHRGHPHRLVFGQHHPGL